MCGCGATAPAPLSVTGTPANEIAAYKILPSHQSAAGYTAIACMWEQAGARRTRPTLGEHHSLISGLVLLFASLLYGRKHMLSLFYAHRHKIGTRLPPTLKRPCTASLTIYRP